MAKQQQNNELTAKQQQDDDSSSFPLEFPVRVGNLPRYLRRNDLRSDLFALFRPFGRITPVYVATDRYTQQCRGFAYVNFADQDDAEAAAEQLNGYGYEHVFLRVHAEEPRARVPTTRAVQPSKTLPSKKN